MWKNSTEEQNMEFFKFMNYQVERLTMDVKICLLFHIIEIFGAEGWSSEAESSWSAETPRLTKLDGDNQKEELSHCILGINIRSIDRTGHIIHHTPI